MEKTSIKVLKSEPCKITITFEVGKEKVGEYLDRIFKEIQKEAQLPGFRVGKAPIETIEKEFSKTAGERMVSKLSTELIYDYIEKENIKTAATPMITHISYEPEKNLTFNVLVERHPEIEVKNYKKIKLTKKTKPTDEADIESRLGLLQERNASLCPDLTKTIDRESFAIIDYTLYADGNKIKNASAQNFLVDVSNQANIKGLNEALIGSKIGDKKTIEVSFPENHPNKNLAGRNGNLEAVVKDVKKKILPNLDDEFAKDLGFESLESLKTNIKSSLVFDEEQKTKENMHKQIEDFLLRNNRFEVPEKITSDYQKSLIESMKRYFLSKGANEQEWDKNKEAVEKKSLEDARDALNLFYIYDFIATAEKISVTDDDLDKTKETLKKIYDKNPADFEKKWQADISQIKYDILKEKVFKFIIDNAIIKEEAVK